MEEPIAHRRRAPSCRVPFANVVPCRLSTRRTLAFDTAALSNGAHAIQIAAYDAGGNRTLSVGPPSSRRNARSRTAPEPPVAHVSQRASHAQRTRGPRAGAPRLGTRRTISRQARRRLRKPDRRGAASQIQARRTGSVDASVRRDREPRQGPFVFRATAGAVEDPAGRLSRLHATTEAPSAVASVTLNVRAGIRLKVTPRRTTSRGTIRFAGKLLGGPGRQGVQVTLYAGGGWGGSAFRCLSCEPTARAGFASSIASVEPSHRSRTGSGEAGAATDIPVRGGRIQSRARTDCAVMLRGRARDRRSGRSRTAGRSGDGSALGSDSDRASAEPVAARHFPRRACGCRRTCASVLLHAPVARRPGPRPRRHARGP